MDTLSSMRVFVRVVELGGFNAAARACAMSAAMVAKHVGHLEERTGARLLDRTTRSVRPTPEGQLYLDKVLAILEAVDEAEGTVGAENRESRGTLRVTAPVELGQDHLAPLLVDFMSRHPGIAVVADLTNRPVDLVQEGFDMAIRVAPSLDTALIGRKLATTHFRVVASADFLARHGVPDTPEMLSALPALTFSQPAPRLDWSWRRREMQGKVRMTARLASTSADTLRKAAVAGLGVSWLPSFVCGKDIEAGLLVPILEDCDWGSLGVHVLYPHRRFVPSRLRLFIDFLAESLGDDPSGDPWAPRAEDRRAMRAGGRSA
ncbi:LysR family transcriptional regulator [Bradyrhizobium sp. R2.2-H]|jgi:DNA-binding transcriptional LysR family regulator|uniref:LysR family transcriptional regulator n=1 Tax=unclassified Bradyrhizobium TaxID=2631580 RepID=UPI001046B375|nr:MULTISPECIES: LysR family transcriptional regulator [unclassified Bradyrhizobium]TCU78336.1 LysR family transcriptional regulator [Bradyrhizobium sp. Y-H1]TCU80420.1 LysR family transcriptional regulator [Bradyrhizobium sp. R2.2-H]